MIRKIIRIDGEKCNGCGACAAACHEGAIALIDGKAKLVREHHCDGLGDCLPACPTGAITFEEREAPAYDEAAVLASKQPKTVAGHTGGGCPGSRMMQLRQSGAQSAAPTEKTPSMLANWPVQMKLVPVKAPYFEGAKLLVAADCTAYAYAAMHTEFLRGHATLIGCPKLDAVEYTEKLTAILQSNDIREVTVVRMEVPCCGGLEAAVKDAIRASGKFLPWRVAVVSVDSMLID